MSWSFRIAQVAGIPIKVHVTFFLVLVLGAVQWGGLTGTAEGALFGVVLTILLFGSVALHELGHSLAARAFGIPVKEIVLLPLGGVAQIARNPEKPAHELVIAVAGPLVNVAIAALLLGPVAALAGPDLLAGEGLALTGQPSLAMLLTWLLVSNISLVLFNLIPAFPLDGGRIFRAGLSMVVGARTATRVAVAVGQVLAVGIGLFGLVAGNFILVLIAVFVFVGAGQETAEAQAKGVLTRRRVGEAYNRHALGLAPGDRVSRVVDYLLTSYQPDFAVLQGGNLVGVVTRDEVLRSLAGSGTDLYVSEIMRRDVTRVDASRSLDEARQIMAEHGVRVAAVYDGMQFLGLVSAEDIGEAYAVLTFVQRQQSLRSARIGSS
jgi:Zn-dependent protease